MLREAQAALQSCKASAHTRMPQHLSESVDGAGGMVRLCGGVDQQACSDCGALRKRVRVVLAADCNCVFWSRFSTTHEVISQWFPAAYFTLCPAPTREQCSLISNRSISTAAKSRLANSCSPNLVAVVGRPRKTPRVRSMAAASPEKVAQNIKPDVEKQVVALAGHSSSTMSPARKSRHRLTPCPPCCCRTSSLAWSSTW